LVREKEKDIKRGLAERFLNALEMLVARVMHSARNRGAFRQ
jgi:hypothetical protein